MSDPIEVHGARAPRRGWAMVCAVVSALAGCEPAEPSCRAEPFEVVATDPARDETPDSLVVREDGRGLVATWIHRPVVTTDSGDVAAPTTRVTFAMLTPEGLLEERRSFAAPERLAEYRSAPLGVGALPTPGGALFHWVEVTHAIDEAGRIETSAELLAQLVRADGSIAELVLPDAQCDDCGLSVASAAHRDRFLIAYASSPAPGIGAGTLGSPARVSALLFDAEGSVVADLDLGALGIVDSVTVETMGPFLAVKNAAATTLLDPASGDVRGVLAGGLAFGRVIASDAGRERLWVATASAGIVPAAVAPIDAPLLLQALAVDGRALTRVERLSTGGGSLAIAATPSGVAVLFDAEGETYLARADASGEKEGGDVALGEATGLHRLIAPTHDELVDVAATTDDVRRRRVICDP